jgi:hypothetical protein
VLDANDWESTIEFDEDIPVSLGGTLNLGFAAGVNLSLQIGRTFDLFNWTGVNPTGTFTVDSPYVWDVSNLYTTGEVKFLAAAGLPGDFNNDNSVDSADYVVWRKGLGTASYSQTAYNVWRSHFGLTNGNGHSVSTGVPEPATGILTFIAGMLVTCFRRRR